MAAAGGGAAASAGGEITVGASVGGADAPSGAGAAA
jgi:hypothetical protein